MQNRYSIRTPIFLLNPHAKSFYACKKNTTNLIEPHYINVKTHFHLLANAPFNSKTYKYSQPSFKMELLRNCVLMNKKVVQWNVTNHMKEPIALCLFSKYQNMFGRINTYHDKIWRSNVNVVNIHILAIWPPICSLYHNVFIHTSNLACVKLFKS